MTKLSYTKKTLDIIYQNNSRIFNETSDDNDLTQILEHLNLVIKVSESLSDKDLEVTPLCNEIIADTISSIMSAQMGFYRLAISGLRNILEMACSVFFYYDHKIEYKLFSCADFKADKYVSSIIANNHFFKSDYIQVFYENIKKIETKNDSCSDFLSTTYAGLCDFTHGRYKTLIHKEKLEIAYNKDSFKKFETIYNKVIGAICLMYFLRFNGFSDNTIKQLALKTNAIKDIK